MNEVLLLIVLLALSALFSGSEIAFFSLSRLRVRYLAEKGLKGAKTLQKLKSQPEKLLIAILIGNNIVNIFAASVATVVAIDKFQSMGVGIATGAMTFLILVFGEITPKAFATRHADWIALKLSRPMRVLQIVLYPIIFLLEIINKAILRIFGEEKQTPMVTEEEMKNIVTVGEEQGEIKKIERELIHNVFKFDEISVKDIMTPRKDVIAIDINAKTDDMVKLVAKTKVTRLPVYETKLDNIKGVLRSKTLLNYVNKCGIDIDLHKLISPAFIVPQTRMIDSLLREFQRRKIHMAIVVDEYGTVVGIITLEDLLEEIVGDIYDEFDEVEHDVIKIDEHLALVGGDTDIEKVNKKLKLRIKQSSDYSTLGGFILKHTGSIPSQGDKISFEKFDVVIERISDNHIEEIKIIKKT